MKTLLKIILILISLLLVVYFSLWGLINIKGRGFLTKKIEEVAKKKVNIQKVSFKPLLGLKIENLYTDNLDFKLLEISLNPLYLLKLRLAFDNLKIEDANLTITKKNNTLIIPVGVTSRKIDIQRLKKPTPISPSQKIPLSSRKKRFRFFIKKLILNKIKIGFYDEDFKVFLILKGGINNLSYPLSSDIFFDITSDLKIEKIFIPDDLTFKGFINFEKKSMDAQLKIKEIPYTAFAKYYPPFWRPQNLGIEKAILSLKANFKSVNNNLDVDCLLRLLEYKFKEIEEEDKTSLLKGMLTLFKNSEGIPTLSFLIKTNFDNPSLDFSIIKNQVKSKIKAPPITYIGKQAIKKVTEASKETTEKAVEVTTKAIGEVLKTPERAVDIIKETGKTLKSIFTSEEEEKEDKKE